MGSPGHWVQRISGSMMLINPSDITGVVLAGGRAQRMHGADKGLLLLGGQPLAGRVLAALKEVAGTVLINANRNAELYRAFGAPVIPDPDNSFQGPLAGILSAMRAAGTPYLLSVPCDNPLLTGPLLRRLVDALLGSTSEIAVASDGHRLHPLVLLAETALADDLDDFLAGGERRVESWIRRRRWVSTDYSDCPEVLANLNTPDELADLSRRLGPNSAY